MDFLARWQKNTIRLLSKSETEGIKWIDICLFCVALSTVVVLVCLPPFREKILLLHSCLFISWRWKHNVYLERRYPLAVITISKIRTQLTRILFEALHEAGEISRISDLKTTHERSALCTPVIYAALYTHMLYPFDLKPKPTTRVICISNELSFLHERAVKYLTTL